ncbi:MAG: DNA recombination protein RmuC [Patescibacteria group bacterium]|jgi:DNA recombination protein RmuC
MQPEIIIVIILLLGLIGAVIALYLKLSNSSQSKSVSDLTTRLQEMREELQRSHFESRTEMQMQLTRVNDNVYKGLSDSQKTIQSQFSQTSKIIEDITAKLTTLDNTNKQVLDFSSQLQSLQNILKNPKQRGVVGEYWLEALLGNVLPKDSYQMQYHMGTDENTGKELIADAVIFIRDQIIPIDAKFSLENYNRIMEEQDAVKREQLEKDLKTDIKLRIDETAKYIQPQKGTMNFSFMFLPAEGVYYNLMNAEIGSGINSRSLIEYAFAKHVMIVSPTSFFAYLQTVLLGMRELQLEKSTQDILKRVADLGKHVRSYAECHDKIGKQLATVVGNYNVSSNELKKVHKDALKITSGDMDDLIEVELVEKPLLEG